MQSRAASGEADTIAGWLAYGAALNEGRALFPGDREFGEWVALSQLDTADRMDRAAAMWAAGNPEGILDAAFDAALQVEAIAAARGISWHEAREFV